MNKHIPTIKLVILYKAIIIVFGSIYKNFRNPILKCVLFYKSINVTRVIDL